MREKLNFRNFKGITLIALVITIIVLLILAGVSISMLTGQNGILSQATNAKNQTEIESEKEAISLAYTSAYADKQGNGKVTASDMNTEFGKNGTTAEASGSIIVYFPDTQRYYQVNTTTGAVTGPSDEKPEENTLVAMFNKAQEDNCTNEDGTCDNPEHLHIGDYVNYQNPTTGSSKIEPNESGVNATQTYSAANNQDLNWRVLGIDEETGGLKLIAGSPMKLDNIDGKNDPYLYLYGAWAYEYGPDAMDRVVREIYGALPNVVDARSVNMEDIDQALGITNDDQKRQYNAMAASGILQLGEQYGPFENQYTPESYINGRTSTTVQDLVTAYCYFIGNEEGMIQSNNSRINSMLFDNVEYRQGRAYWLAARGASPSPGNSYANFAPFAVNEYEGVVRAGCGRYAFDSYGYENGDCYAVRPVVILESGVTSDDISKVGDKTEETWNYNGGNWNVETLTGSSSTEPE